MRETLLQTTHANTSRAGLSGRNSRRAPYLVAVRGASPGHTYTLDRDELMIGRGSDVAISVFDPAVSRNHARIVRVDGEDFVLEDLGSRNGTWVNGERIKKHALRIGDIITVGSNTSLKFDYFDPFEEHLRESQKMEAIGRLAGGVAHDFNNLLAVIIGNLTYVNRILEQPEADTQGVPDAVADCLHAAKCAAGLTDKLLGFARRGGSALEVMSMSKLMRQVTQLARHTFDRNIRIDVDVADSLTVLGDNDQLQQVFLNLCVNARDAMPEGGVLRITAARTLLDGDDVPTGLQPGHYVQLRVSDTGQGMDEETRKRIFEPFFTTKEVGKGTGLGLAIVYGIIGRHSGHVSVESTPGQGSTFTVYLPLVQSESKSWDGETSERSTEERLAAPSAASGMILLVDDEEMVRSSGKRWLEQLGYSVLLAADGAEAVDLYRERCNDIDAVLLDLIMPTMSGDKAFREIRALDAGVKAIISSGYSEDERVQAVLQEGATGFLPKPYSFDDLARAIEAILEPRRVAEAGAEQPGPSL